MNVGKRKAGTPPTASGFSRKLFSNSAEILAPIGQNFKGELWPVNVSRLHEAGIPFEWRRGNRDIVATCGSCGGRLIIDADQPYLICMGQMFCEANHVSFPQVIKTLAEKSEAKL